MTNDAIRMRPSVSTQVLRITAVLWGLVVPTRTWASDFSPLLNWVALVGLMAVGVVYALVVMFLLALKGFRSRWITAVHTVVVLSLTALAVFLDDKPMFLKTYGAYAITLIAAAVTQYVVLSRRGTGRGTTTQEGQERHDELPSAEIEASTTEDLQWEETD